MNTLINVLKENQYFKLSAKSLLQNLELGEKLDNDLSKIYDLNSIYAISQEDYHYYGTPLELYKITMKLPHLNFNIQSQDKEIISGLKLKKNLYEFIVCLCNGLSNEELKEVNSYIQNKYDLKCRLFDTEGILNIPVIVDREIYLTTTLKIINQVTISELNTSLHFDFIYPKDESSLFYTSNGLFLPNQYDRGALCLGENKKYPNNINTVNLYEEFNVFKEGIFNRDISYVPYNKYFFDYILDTIKYFSVKNQFNSDLQKSKVSKLLIKQLNKEEIKSDLNRFLNNVVPNNNDELFRHNYSLYLLLSIFH